jgi:hypothetical protein
MPSEDYSAVTTEGHEELLSCNHTELYQLCRSIGKNPDPAMSKHELIGLVTGTIIPGTAQNPVDEWREEIMAFLLNHWKKVSGQLMCPAKTGDKKACYQCLDAQVLHCMSRNNVAEQDILVTIKKNHLEKTMPIATPPMAVNRLEVVKPEDAPRTIEELVALKRNKLIALIYKTDVKQDTNALKAVMTLSDPELAEEVLKALQRWDVANGRAVAQAPARVVQEAPQETVPAPVARRRGRPAAEVPAAPVQATPVTMPAPTATPGNPDELRKALAELEEKFEAQAEEHQHNFKVTFDMLQSMNNKLNVLESAMYTALSAILGQSEMHFGIPKPDYLELSMSDAGDVSTALGKARQG